MVCCAVLKQKANLGLCNNIMLYSSKYEYSRLFKATSTLSRINLKRNLFFIRIGLPSTLKRRFRCPKTELFWKRSPKWMNWKTPAKCVSVDSESGTFWKRWRHNSHVTLSQSLLNHWSKMADELLIMLLCLLSLWIACLEINVALYNLYATALHRSRNTVCSPLLSNGPQQTLRRYRVRPYLERGRFWTRLTRALGTRLSGHRSGVEAAFQRGQRNSLKTILLCGRRSFYPFSRQKMRFQIYPA